MHILELDISCNMNNCKREKKQTVAEVCIKICIISP